MYTNIDTYTCTCIHIERHAGTHKDYFSFGRKNDNQLRSLALEGGREAGWGGVFYFQFSTV